MSSGLTERRMKIKIILLVEKDNVIRQVFIYKDYRLHQKTGLIGLEQKENIIETDPGMIHIIHVHLDNKYFKYLKDD